MGAVVIVAGLGVAPQVVVAQSTDPVSLQAPKRLGPAPRAARETPRGRVTAPAPAYKKKRLPSVTSGIQVDQLGDVDPDSAGILSIQAGGFDADLWQGSRMSMIRPLLEAGPHRVSSRVLRGLVRRMLLSAAAPPAGKAGGDSFAARRLDVLIAMGEHREALELLQAMPREGRGTGFLRIETELRLINRDPAPACRTVAAEVTRRADAFWQKALIYCQILAGEMDKAELGLSLLRETGLDDRLFLDLADGLIAGAPVLPDHLDGLGLLHLAMLRTAKLDLPLKTARRHPAALGNLAMSKAASAAERADAIEVAAEGGMYRDCLLKRLYESVPLPDPAGAAEPPEAGSPLERARLYQAAKLSKIPTAKAEAASRALLTAREAGRFGGVARLFRPILVEIPPSNDSLWFAPLAFRALVMAGETEKADPWLRLSRRYAAITADAEKLFREMAPLARLFDALTSESRAVPSVIGRPAAQVVLFFSLVQAMGGDVPLEKWDPLVFKTVNVTPLPDAALWSRLRHLNARALPERRPATAAASSVQTAAATAPALKVVGPTVRAEALAPPGAAPVRRDGRLGERLLLIALALGDRPLADSNPVVVAELVRGLRQAGLAADARALALEAAINAGL